MSDTAAVARQQSPDGFCDFPKAVRWVVTGLSLDGLVPYQDCPHCLFSAKLNSWPKHPLLCLVFMCCVGGVYVLVSSKGSDTSLGAM